MRTPSVLVSRSIAARHRVLVRGPGEGREHEARAPVLHLRRRRPDVERAGGEARGRRVGRELGQEVVEVGLDQRDRRRGGAAGGAPTIDAHEVRLRGEVARAGAVADAPRASSAAAARSALGERGDERGARRRDELRRRARRRRAARPRAARASRAPAAAGGRAPRRRSRARRAAASRRRGRSPSASSASATPQTSPIASTAPTSWKCTRSGSIAVDAPLRVREPAERLLRAGARAARRSPARVDLRADRGPVAVRLPGRAADRRVRGRDAVAQHALRASARARRPPAPPGRGAHGVGGPRPRRAARRAACRRRCRRGSRGTSVRLTPRRPPARAIRAAIVPAPKPSSMLTTATPPRTSRAWPAGR